MPFSFLNPWLWLGAVALAAPVWLHLRRRQPTNLHRFSTVRFLDDQPEPKRSPLRPRDLLLLALRALSLLLLVAALAWPYLRGVNTVPIEESRVYIVDNTLSRQANNDFARDRDRVLEAVSRAGSEVQIALIELTSAPRVAVAFGDSRPAAIESIRRLQPSFERGSYLAAFRQANALLANSLGRQKRIVFCSDNQENQWNEGINTPAFLRNVKVDMSKTVEATLPNLSLADPRVQRIFLGEKSLVNFTVKLSHNGPAQSANVVLHANGQTILNREMALEGQPETILLQAQWEADPADWLLGEVVVEGTPDTLPADDRVFFSLAPVVEGTVALLAQSPYLRVALSPEIMRGEWATRLLDPARLGNELAANQDAEVLCLESAYLQSADARRLLSRYLSNGRGVLLLVNRTTPAIDGCLRELGFQAEGTARAEPGDPDRFQFILSNHPIFHPFLSPDYGNLMEVRISEYVRLKSSDALPLVFAENGPGLFFQGTRTQGKLFVCAFGLDREHTSWPLHQTFIPFLDLTLQAARAHDSTPPTFEPGETANLQLAASGAPRELVVREDGRELWRATVEQGRARVRVPEKPGLYGLTFDDAVRVEKVLCVNPSPKESQLSFTDPAPGVKAWQVDPTGTVKPAATTPTPAQVSLTGVLQQRLWWWMLLGGLVGLQLEMAWAAVRKQTT